MSEDYKVGHKKPPLETRIQKGQRLNPKGRPKRKKPKREESIADDLEEALQQQVVVTLANGKTRKMSARKAIAFKTVANALKEDKHAHKAVFDYERSQGAFEPPPPKGKYGVVVLQQPCRSEEEFEKRAAEMPPLPVDPLEGLPGIDRSKLKSFGRSRTPEEVD